MKFSNKILYRYESQIDGGKLFLFDLENYKMFHGTIVEYQILKGIDRNSSVSSIAEAIQEQYGINDCENKVVSFVNFLKDKGYVID